jgi:hypothetical protein
VLVPVQRFAFSEIIPGGRETELFGLFAFAGQVSESSVCSFVLLFFCSFVSLIRIHSQTIKEKAFLHLLIILFMFYIFLFPTPKFHLLSHSPPPPQKVFGWLPPLIFIIVNQSSSSGSLRLALVMPVMFFAVGFGIVAAQVCN